MALVVEHHNNPTGLRKSKMRKVEIYPRSTQATMDLNKLTQLLYQTLVVIQFQTTIFEEKEVIGQLQ